MGPRLTVSVKQGFSARVRSYGSQIGLPASILMPIGDASAPRAQMQQASTQSGVRAASAAQQAPAGPGAPQTDAAAADVEDEQQPPHLQQNEQAGPQTLEQLQNGQPLTEAQQRQMQASAAKQQRAAEQRQQLVDRARQVVATAGCNGQQTRAGTDGASASVDLARQQHLAPAAGTVAPAELAAQLVAKLEAAAVTLDAAAPQDAARPAADEEHGSRRSCSPL